MALTLISTHTASADSSIDITSGITSAYKSYEWHFVNLHAATDSVNFTFQVNATDGADYNDSAITSTFFAAYHNESDSGYGFVYEADFDQAQGTAYQVLANYVGNDNDQSCNGVLTLYNPSSTTYVKHFVSRLNNVTAGDYSRDNYAAGYINDTTAIDNISFKFSSGNIDAGVIKMYGVAKA